MDMEATEEVQKTVSMLGRILILNHLQIINVYLGQGTEEVRASHSMVLSKAVYKYNDTKIN